MSSALVCDPVAARANGAVCAAAASAGPSLALLACVAAAAAVAAAAVVGVGLYFLFSIALAKLENKFEKELAKIEKELAKIEHNFLAFMASNFGSKDSGSDDDTLTKKAAKTIHRFKLGADEMRAKNGYVAAAGGNEDSDAAQKVNLKMQLMARNMQLQ
jgi:Skp family chaperone for outer membrane proteins